MSQLISPLTIKGIIVKNRIVNSFMCQYSATDGFSNDWHLVQLDEKNVGWQTIAPGFQVPFSEAIRKTI